MVEKDFLDRYLDNFAEYFEQYKILKLMKNKEYRKTYNEICKIKNESPNIRECIENKKTIELKPDEVDDMVKIFNLHDVLTVFELEEAFKLGFFEAWKFYSI